MEVQENTQATPAASAPSAPAEKSHAEQFKDFRSEIRGEKPAAQEATRPEPVQTEKPANETKAEPVAKQPAPEQKKNRGDERFGKLKRESEKRISELNERIKRLETQVKPRDQYNSDAEHAAAVASVETAKQMAQGDIANSQEQIAEADRAIYAEKVANVADRGVFEGNLQQFGKWIDANDPITLDFAMTHDNGFQVLDIVMRQFAVPGMLEQWNQFPLYKRAEILNGLASQLKTANAPAPTVAPAAPTLTQSIAPEFGDRVSAPSSDTKAVYNQFQKEIRANNRR